MTFLNPGLLYALGAAAVPLLLHLIRQRRRRVIRWAAWRFLAQSQQRLRRRLRIEQILLAALRALIVCAIALAFARPVIRSPNAMAGASREPIHAVIALDDSMSMRWMADGTTDFQRAQAAADRIITRLLRPGDTVSAALISDHPRALIRQPSHDLQAARARIRSVRAGYNATDYEAAAELCRTLAAPSPAGRKEVFLLTDTQASGLRQTRKTDRSGVWQALAKTARIVWIDIGDATRPNVSIAPPTFSRDLITGAAPVRLISRIGNYTGAAQPATRVRLEVDGAPVGAADIAAPVERPAEAAFTHLFDRQGTRTGAVVLDRPDGLMADNTAWFAVRVQATIRALVIGSTESAGGAGAALYVATALAPVSVAEGGGGIIVRVLPEIGSQPLAPGQPDALVLAAVPRYSDRDINSLTSYVRAGGGVMVMPATSGNGLAQVIRALRIPGLECTGVSTAPLRNAFSLDPASFDHPALRAMGAGGAGLSDARFTIRARMAVRDTAGAPRVIARFSDGAPAILEAVCGRGRLIVFAFTAAPPGSDLPLKPAFVPLIHQCIAYLASLHADQRMIDTGAATVVSLPIGAAQSPFRITAPSGDAATVRPTLRDAALLLPCPIAQDTGIYRIAGTGPFQGHRDAYAANPKARESDLRKAPPAEIRNLAGSDRILYVHGDARLTATVREAREGREISATLLTLALILMALEIGIAGRWTKRT